MSVNCIFSQDLLTLIKKRRSIRVFDSGKIPREQVLRIVEAGVWAPSGCNNQELRFLILDGANEVAEVMEFKRFKGVSVIVLVFYDLSLPLSKMYAGKSSAHLPFVDAGFALANMILYAKSLGVDSCVFNVSRYHFKIAGQNRCFLRKVCDRLKIIAGLGKRVDGNFEFYLRNRLSIPKHLKILCGVAFGYATKVPELTEFHCGKPIMRKPVNDYLLHLE